MHHRPLSQIFRVALCSGFLYAVLSGSGYAQVYRCDNAYSQTPCPNGQTIETPAQSSAADTNSSSGNAAFLCRRGNQEFWSPNACQTQGASLLRRHSVPSHWSWERQKEYAEREWQRAERRTAVQAPMTHSADTSATAQHHKERPECAQIAQRLRQLDEIGRQGGSASLMERQRTERRELRDLQFRSGC